MTIEGVLVLLIVTYSSIAVLRTIVWHLKYKPRYEKLPATVLLYLAQPIGTAGDVLKKISSLIHSIAWRINYGRKN